MWHLFYVTRIYLNIYLKIFESENEISCLHSNDCLDKWNVCAWEVVFARLLLLMSYPTNCFIQLQCDRCTDSSHFIITAVYSGVKQSEELYSKFIFWLTFHFYSLFYYSYFHCLPVFSEELHTDLFTNTFRTLPVNLICKQWHLRI